MTAYLLGVDIGTTAIKAAIFDLEGREIGGHIAEYSLLTPQPGHVELEAATYLETFALAVRNALEQAKVSGSDLAVLGLSAQGETLLCLDGNNQPLIPAIVWMDSRAGAEADEIEAHFGREHIHTITGQVAMDAIWPASKILWLRRNQPGIFANIKRFSLLKDFIVLHLTGRLVSEDSLLCSAMLWDINTRQYWPEILEYLGISESQLPEIAKQGEIIGNISAHAAELFGLPAGLPVSVGALDQACGALGVGNVVPGIFSEGTGSALACVTISEKLVLDPAAAVPCFPAAIAGQYMLHTFSTGGMAMRWFRDEFCSSEKRIESLCGINAYTLIDREVEQVPPGADGLIVLPHLQGSGPPDLNANACGVFFGLTLAHKKQHFSRGIMEGIAMVLRRMMEAITRLDVELKEIVSLSGGARSAAWCQIKSDVTQRQVHTLRASENAACRGAALIAAANLGLYDDLAAVARQGLEFEHHYLPNPENAAVYDCLFEKYARLSDAIAPLLRADGATV